jgi:hypothetical protein
MTSDEYDSSREKQSANTTPTPCDDAAVGARHWYLMLLAALLPVVALVVLFTLEVPLGKPGKFVYLYSPIVSHRLASLPNAIFIAAFLAGGVWLALSERRGRRRVGVGLVMVACIAGAAWAYFAPPQFRSQHFFNMQSPSHDGAFLTEAFHVREVGVRNYLRSFPQRAQTPPEEMRGTRVISNPPGMTLIAVGTISVPEHSPWLRQALQRVGAEDGLPDGTARLVTASTGFALALLLLWLLAAPCLYGVGRAFFPLSAAAVFTIVCLFSPMTLLFAPGKDTAQLFTVALPLWLWLVAWRRSASWTAALAGGAFGLACLVSLVHVWIALVVLLASALSTPVSQWPRFARQVGLPAVLGAGVIVGALLLAGLNVFAAGWAATRAQAEITRGPDAMPFVWQLLGIPLFLLFAGPALWCAGLWLPRSRLRDPDARFGLYLLTGALIVMVATIGFTNVETPRLWIPFTPLLLLGAALQLSWLRRPNRWAAVLLATLVFLQFATAAVQWSLMDMREAETRLLRTGDHPARLFE